MPAVLRQAFFRIWIEVDSMLTAYQAQQSRLPMEFSLAYRERFKGDGPSSGQANPVLYTRWVVAGMKFWF